MKVKKIIGNILFFLVILMVLLYVLTCKSYYIETGSMEPELKTGAIAVVLKNKLPEAGDICAYQNGRNIVVHRVIDITEDGYITKGDSNEVPDSSPVSEEQIKGTVILKINFIAPLLKKLTDLF